MPEYMTQNVCGSTVSELRGWGLDGYIGHIIVGLWPAGGLPQKVGLVQICASAMLSKV
jgi:hypothetical protein